MKNKNGEQNHALHMDMYLARWMYIYWKKDIQNTKVVFDVFFRKNPFKNGYSVFGGLRMIIDYLENINFEKEKVDFIEKKLGIEFEKEFKELLTNYRFNGNMYAVEEGEVIFPNIPLIRLESTIFELKALQTAILTMVNHESLIGTICSRIKQAAINYGEIRGIETPTLFEGGARRAHGIDAAHNGSRMSYIAGFDSTSLLSAGSHFDLPVGGTMEHADIQMYEDLGGELEAFRTFAEEFPNDCVFLVDTYNTLNSGVPNAITVAKELKSKGYKLKGIRIDSGDLAYLSKEARKMLDREGLYGVKIIASGDMDEYTIEELAIQKAEIDSFLVGTKAITAYNDPAFGAVYKIVAKETKKGYLPLIKISSSVNKITNPGYQTVYRIIDNETGKFKGDYIALVNEEVKTKEKISLQNVREKESKDEVTNFTAEELLKPIYVEGKLVYSLPTAKESREFHERRIKGLWEEYKRKAVPQEYSVTVSDEIIEIKKKLFKEKKENKKK